MARKFLTAIDLAKNELQNGVVQNLGSAPSSPVKGQLYMNSADNTLYWWDGTAWVSARGGGTGFPGFGPSTASTTFGATKSDGVATTTARADHTHGTPTHVNADHGAINLSALAVPTAIMNMGGFRVNNVGTPVNGTDATTKDYVDNLSAGLAWKDAVRVATTANIANLGSVGTIDGVTLADGDRVLVKDQTSTQFNGIYTYTTPALARSSDCDTSAEILNFTVFVSEGTQADTAWVCTANAPITVNTTLLPIVQFGAGTSYTAGAGMALSGSTFSVGAANGSITVGADDIQVAFAGAGSAVTAARSDHTHAGVYTAKYVANLAGSATSYTVTHNLGTKDVMVAVWRVASPYDTVECDVERTTTTQLTIRFNTAPTANEYNVTVIG